MEATAHHHHHHYHYDNDNSVDDDGTVTSWKSRAAVALLGLFGVGPSRRTRPHGIDYDADDNGSSSSNESQDDDGNNAGGASRQPLVGARRDRRSDKSAKRIERNRRALRDCGLD
ncbi:hypothetical protein pmac_cds_105 [Pandoravirus macleodensis]|uniref:Uncharacterized protein n=1 Tax=Pandoravirus macleodensis TaxID=2107707 RepID=A0A2U7UED0_9VIRU|nr:hypothetical protein pmac_cds_105 [Pandoravirus macleodensis]AVK76793.1 hypothetical protein pmac_cds_105 [Pandoravirus macleodensis]UMO79359.1 hypothetical protein [Pandoravirus aubagnensis]